MEKNDILKHLCVCLDNVPAEKAPAYIEMLNRHGIYNYEAPAYNNMLMTFPGVVAIKSIFPREYNDLFMYIHEKKHAINEAVQHIEKILNECPDTVKAINFGCPAVKSYKPVSLIGMQYYAMSLATFLCKVSDVIQKIRQTRGMPDLLFCLEPTAAKYGSDILTTPSEVLTTIHCIFEVEDTVKMLFDLGNEVTTLNDNPIKSMSKINEDLKLSDFSRMGHIHISPTYIGAYLYSEDINRNDYVNIDYQLIEGNIIEALEANPDNFPYISLESKICAGQSLKDAEKDLEVFINRMTNCRKMFV